MTEHDQSERSSHHPQSLEFVQKSSPPLATVVLVDDDPDVATVEAMLLFCAGFTVFTAHTGADGIQLINRVHPDLVVLDIDLPDMSGIDVCLRLKAETKTKQIPVVFCSGNPELFTKAFAAGGAACVEKPGDIVKLPPRVIQVLKDEQDKGSCSH